MPQSAGPQSTEPQSAPRASDGSTARPSLPTVGQSMPDLPVTRTDGMPTTLAALRGTGPTVYYFMRTATCPICLGHIGRMSALLAAGELAAGSVIVAAPGSVDEARTAEKRIANSAVTVVASGDGHAEAGLGRFLMMQHSGTFVVDAAGTLVSVRASAMPTSSFSAAEVLAAR